jgi:hypothetical protein
MNDNKKNYYSRNALGLVFERQLLGMYLDPLAGYL